MSIEGRIRELVEEIIASHDDGRTAVLTEELLEVILVRVTYLRTKLGVPPLDPNRGVNH